MRLAQLDRAFDYGSKGRGFESSNARYYVRFRTLRKVAEIPIDTVFQPFSFFKNWEWQKPEDFISSLFGKKLTWSQLQVVSYGVLS